MTRLSEIDNVAARALQFQILTAARPGEVLGAPWDEIRRDYEDDEIHYRGPTWEIPAARMKAFRRHRIPLSAAALAILKTQERKRGSSRYIFPGQRNGRPTSNTALTDELKRLGLASLTTVHGLRASFRSWCASTSVPDATAECALAHAIGNAVAQAYDRGDRLQQRVELMGRWAEYCLGLKLLPKPEAALEDA
jgi:integrase